MASLLSQEGPGSAGWPWGKSGRQRVGLGPGKWRGIARVSVGRPQTLSRCPGVPEGEAQPPPSQAALIPGIFLGMVLTFSPCICYSINLIPPAHTSTYNQATTATSPASRSGKCFFIFIPSPSSISSRQTSNHQPPSNVVS